jgi:hypothetical protein
VPLLYWHHRTISWLTKSNEADSFALSVFGPASRRLSGTEVLSLAHFVDHESGLAYRAHPISSNPRDATTLP